MSTIEYERLADGRIAAWVFTLADRVLLRRCGELLAHDFGGEAFERFDAMDQIFWDFLVAGQRVTLRLAEGRGIAVESGDTTARSDELVRQIAMRLGTLEPGAAKP